MKAKKKKEQGPITPEPSAPAAPPNAENCCFVAIREPGTIERVNQFLLNLGDLEIELNRMRAALFGEDLPIVVFPLGKGMEQMLANAGTRIAGLLGDARTINSRLNQ